LTAEFAKKMRGVQHQNRSKVRHDLRKP